MRVFIFLFYIVLFNSCNNHKNEGDTIKVSDNRKYVQNLTERCIKNGDSKAFGELVDFYGRNPSERYELLPISIIMADKYNNDNARVTIYFQMIMINNNGKRIENLFFRLNQKHKDFIVSYLIEGAKNKNSGCKAILKKVLNGGYRLKNEDEKLVKFLIE